MKKRSLLFVLAVLVLILLVWGSYSVGEKRTKTKYREYASEMLRAKVLLNLESLQDMAEHYQGDKSYINLANDLLLLNKERQSLMNIFVPETLGLLSEGNSVWLELGDCILDKEINSESLKPDQLNELSAVCEKYVPLFSKSFSSVVQFENCLKELENELSAWLLL